MFNLPKSTRVRKNIYKKAIFERFSNELIGSKKERFNNDISKIVITNELSEQSINVPKTNEVSAIFVVRIDLKNKEYLNSNIELISKLFGQKLLIVLSYEDEYRLAIYETKLLVNDWENEEKINLTLTGLNLKSVWENLVTQVGSIQIEEGNTLIDQIRIEDKKAELRDLIDITEKKARRESQAKKKFKLFKDIKRYKKELEEL